MEGEGETSARDGVTMSPRSGLRSKQSRDVAPDGRRPDGRRAERGASMVEFVLVAPILCLLLFAIIDFGLVLSDDIGLKQGVREAARQGAVAEFGSSASCGSTASGTDEMKRLACLTKTRSDIDASRVRVAIRFADAEDQLSDDPDVGDALVVCATTPMESRTGFFSGLMGGRHIQSVAVMRIEVASEGLAPFSETDSSGDGWSWCRPRS